jgi:hypothetical protein
MPMARSRLTKPNPVITGYWHLQTERLRNPKNSIVTNDETAISKSF